MSIETTELDHITGRVIDVQVNSPPAEESVVRGKIARLRADANGLVILIEDLASYDQKKRSWGPLSPAESELESELDLRSVEGRRIYLPPVTLPDGSIDIVLLDGRSAVVHPKGSPLHAEPLKVMFSLSDFLARVS